MWELGLSSSRRAFPPDEGETTEVLVVSPPKKSHPRKQLDTVLRFGTTTRPLLPGHSSGLKLSLGKTSRCFMKRAKWTSTFHQTKGMTTKSEQQGYCNWKGSAMVEMTVPTVSKLWNSLVWLFFVALQWWLLWFKSYSGLGTNTFKSSNFNEKIHEEV